MRKPGLGRGLSALMDEVAAARPADAPRAGPMIVPIASVAAHPGQPRRRFDAAALAELTDSVRTHGILQPILVRPLPEGRYEIVAGERRWRAAQAAGLHEIPVTVRDLDDRTTFEIALIENIQRADLNAIEEAEGYVRLVDHHGYTPDKVAAAIGKSVSHVRNIMRLLELPDDIRQMVVDGRLSMGHARTIIAHYDAHDLAKRAVANGWSVRQLEAAARKPKPEVELKPDSGRVRTGGRDPNLVTLEESLEHALGVPVEVVPGEEGPYMGTVTIHYRLLDQLDMICQRLMHGGQFD